MRKKPEKAQVAHMFRYKETRRTLISYQLKQYILFKILEKASLEKLFQVVRCCFRTSKTDPNGKGHAKSKDIKHNLILLQINSLYRNGPENQVVACCDNYTPLVEVACEYFSTEIQ